MVLENEGDAIRIWPVVSTGAASLLVERAAEFGEFRDIIISNQTMSADLRSRAKTMGWGLLHYSELGRWMQSEFRLGTFKDL